MKTYCRWIEVYQRIPNLEDDTTKDADIAANLFEQELSRFVKEFNKQHKTDFDIGEFDSKFEGDFDEGIEVGE